MPRMIWSAQTTVLNIKHLGNYVRWSRENFPNDCCANPFWLDCHALGKSCIEKVSQDFRFGHFENPLWLDCHAFGVPFWLFCETLLVGKKCGHLGNPMKWFHRTSHLVTISPTRFFCQQRRWKGHVTCARTCARIHRPWELHHLILLVCRHGLQHLLGSLLGLSHIGDPVTLGLGI
jgi:hypothetical protein